MLPGPDLIYECSHCSTPLKVASLASGNTFGAEFFSDGKYFAPMLPAFPEITRCKQCRQIFWISRLSAVTEYEYHEKMPPRHAAAAEAEFLTADDYREVLKNKIYQDTEEEIFARRQLWWLQNDRFRGQAEGEPDVAWTAEWAENCRRLNALITEDNGGRSLMKAELLRNLAEFAESRAMLQRINNTEYNWIIPQLLQAAEQQQRYVFRLQSEFD